MIDTYSEKGEVKGYYNEEYSNDLGGWIFYRKCLQTQKMIKEVHKKKLIIVEDR